MVESNQDVDLSVFDDLVEEVKNNMDTINKQSVTVRLQLYSFGKQGKFGDCSEPKPGFFAVKEKKKWEAWESLKGMDADEAKKQFILIAKPLLGK
jgi:acyl-CoA-binding protein